MLVICYPGCSTCKKALKWLDARNLTYEYRNIKQERPTEEELRQWIAWSGLPARRFFNTSGGLYRELNLKDKLAQMSDEEMIQLLSTDGMLVKRPLVICADRVLVGFREEEYKQLL